MQARTADSFELGLIADLCKPSLLQSGFPPYRRADVFYWMVGITQRRIFLLRPSPQKQAAMIRKEDHSCESFKCCSAGLRTRWPLSQPGRKTSVLTACESGRNGSGIGTLS